MNVLLIVAVNIYLHFVFKHFTPAHITSMMSDTSVPY